MAYLESNSSLSPVTHLEKFQQVAWKAHDQSRNRESHSFAFFTGQNSWRVFMRSKTIEFPGLASPVE